VFIRGICGKNFLLNVYKNWMLGLNKNFSPNKPQINYPQISVNS